MSSEAELKLIKNEITNLIRNCKDTEEKKRLILKAQRLGEELKQFKTKIDKDDVLPIVVPTDLMVCDHCKKNFECKPQKNRSTWIVYCKECRKIRGTDLIEIILPNQPSVIYQQHEVENAETMLKSLNADIRLDLHKTLDTVSAETKLFTTETQKAQKAQKTCCCVSYVGMFTSTRLNARDDITNRIRCGQISFGVLVFKRGRDDNTPFVDIGSKAWFNKQLPCTTIQENALFIDDSMDHVISVKAIGIKSILITPQKQLLKLLN
jgi:hypothetical protein